MNFATFAFLSFFGFVLLVAGVVYYLKRRGVLRAAADAAKATIKQDVTDAAKKL